MKYTQPQNKLLIITAWVAILASSLPNIILQELFHYTVSEELKVGIPGLIAIAGFGLTFLWQAIRTLRSFFGLLVVLVGVQWLVYSKVDQLPFYQDWLHNPSFNVYMLAEQSLRLMVTLAVIAVLFAVKKKANAFFLVKGDTAAPVEPVKWLGSKPGERWNTSGRRFAFFISLGTLAFLVIAGRPPLDIVIRAIPFIPAVLLAAALNAFSEEMTFKASFLSVLESPAGRRRQSLLLMAAFFGIGHYYGIPYGIIGVLMADFLGWLLGKSMLKHAACFGLGSSTSGGVLLIFSFLAIR